jgi:hypothetical protein
MSIPGKHKIWKQFVVFLLAVHTLTGCAIITYNVRKDVLPTTSTRAMVQQWPLTVGVFVPSSVKTQVFSKDLWRVPAGEATASTFQWAVQQMFTHTVDLDVLPSAGTVPSGLAGVIELSDIRCDYSMLREYQYEFVLYSRKGEVVGLWTIT